MTPPFDYCPRCGKASPEFEHNKEVHCQFCGLRYFHNVAAAVGAFIRYGDEVLFAVRAQPPAQGMLDLPGGFMEAGESLEQGLRREVAEELGIELPSLRYLFSFANDYPYEGILYRTIDVLFEAVYQRRPVVSAADDVAAVHWTRLSDIALADIAFASIRQAVATLRQADGHASTPDRRPGA